MPSTLERNFNLCFPKIKRPPPPHRRRTATSFLISNFNSLYDPFPTASISSGDPPTAAAAGSPDFATAVASNRFFFSSPGRSNSIVDSSSPSTSSLASTSSSSVVPPEDGFAGGGVAIATLSPDPYVDFRSSMQEMVEARDLVDARANREYLHELLTCYLALNPKHTHKFIVAAFSDLLITLTAEDGGHCRNS